MLRTRPLVVGTVLVALALGTSCTYVDQQTLLDKLDSIDDDGDGDPNDSDCAPDDPLRANTLDETAYDGIDNDCGQDGDLVDVDDDGYPGMSYDDWIAQEAADADNWPSSVSQTEEDCDDEEDTVNPGEDETHYDGIDQNCNGDDDEYDRDEDGYVHQDYADVYTGDLPATDCDDDEETTYPGADDEWYDGVDSDCGEDNDFDADDDGWARLGDEDALETYEATYGYGIDTDATGDCDDDEPTTYPGADDDWYDGIDSDCAEDNDFDADVDGWTPDEYTTDLATYEDTYGYGIDTSALGDCDDGDDTVHPETLEILDDSTDQDCDGGDDTTAFTYALDDYEWDTPRRPVLGADDYHYLLVTTATQLGSIEELGTAMYFDLAPGWGESPEDEYNWHTTGGNTLHDDLDALFYDGGFYATTSYTTGSKAALITYQAEWDASSGAYSRPSSPYGFANHQTSTTDVYTAIDLLEAENGDIYAIGCGDETVEIVQGEYDSSVGHIQRGDGDADDYQLVERCFLQEQDSSTFYVNLSDGSDVTTYEFWTSTGDLEGTSSSQPWSGTEMGYVIAEDGWVMYADPSGGIVLDDGDTTYSLLESYDVESFDVAWEGGDVFISVVDTDGALTLAYGSPSGTLEEVDFDLATEDGDDALALYTGIYVDSDYVMLAHSGFTNTDDVVGWAFIGR